ncbi:MAG: hypothetical protein HOQ05_09355 [Corynebacteriales bacterium]|nr:hypothetical protein [Mycobacteriales bacterium]
MHKVIKRLGQAWLSGGIDPGFVKPGVSPHGLRVSVTLSYVRLLRAFPHCAAGALSVVLAFICGTLQAQPAAHAAPEESGPTTLCTASDERLGEISGLAATDSGFLAINDTGESNADSLRVFELDEKCEVTDVQNWTGSDFDPLDPEDLARTSDGTIWIADIGDNDASRPRAAVWRIAPGKDPVLHRLTYPEGARDAEALLMQGNTPIVVTKDATGVSQIYVGSKELTADTTDITRMRSAGSVTFTGTGTPGGDAVGIGEVAQVTITGGAVSPDGKKVALRTYTDAYEWDVPNGDIATAITSSEPRRTPLPNEPQGEAITYSADGKNFITTTEGADPPLLQWAPAAPPGSDSKSGSAAKKGDSGPWYKDVTLDQVMYGIYCVGAVGLILLAGGIYGIIRHRRRVKSGMTGEDNASRDDELDDRPPPRTPEAGRVYGTPAQLERGRPMREIERGPRPPRDLDLELDRGHGARERDDRAGWPPEPESRPRRSGEGAVYGGQPQMSLPPNPNRRPQGSTRQPDRRGGAVYGGKPDNRDQGRPPGTVYGG